MSPRARTLLSPSSQGKRLRGKADCSLPVLYPSFLELMEARSRGHASPPAANGQSPSSGSQSPVVPPSAVSTGSSSPGTPQPAPQLPLHTPPAGPCPPPPTEAPLPPAAPAPRRSIISRLFGTSPAAEAAPPPPGEPQERSSGCGWPRWSTGPMSLQTGTGSSSFLLPPGQVAPQPSQMGTAQDRPGGGGRWTSGNWLPLSTEPAPAAEAPTKVQNVEDFVPEEGLDRSFLDDTVPQKDEKKAGAKVLQDSDR